MRRAASIALLCVVSALLSGCGGGGGVSEGATVTVYVVAPLCAGAKRALAKADGRAGTARVRAVCLADERAGARLDLATVGANARRATEDSAAVAYLELPEPAVSRFTNPILESADLGWGEDSSGAAAMGRVLEAISSAGGGSLRDAVREALEEVG